MDRHAAASVCRFDGHGLSADPWPEGLRGLGAQRSAGPASANCVDLHATAARLGSLGGHDGGTGGGAVALKDCGPGVRLAKIGDDTFGPGVLKFAFEVLWQCLQPAYFSWAQRKA